jgi:hypothetical protein
MMSDILEDERRRPLSSHHPIAMLTAEFEYDQSSTDLRCPFSSPICDVAGAGPDKAVQRTQSSDRSAAVRAAPTTMRFLPVSRSRTPASKPGLRQRCINGASRHHLLSTHARQR